MINTARYVLGDERGCSRICSRVRGVGRAIEVLILTRDSDRPSGSSLPSSLGPLTLVLVGSGLHSGMGRAMGCFGRRNIALGMVSNSDIGAIGGVTVSAKVRNTRGTVSVSAIAASGRLRSTTRHYGIFNEMAPTRGGGLIITLGGRKRSITVANSKMGSILTLGRTSYSMTVTSNDSTTQGISRLMLIGGSFNTVPDIITRNEQAVGGLRQDSTLCLMGAVCSIVLSVFFVFFHVKCPFRPVRLALINTLAIKLPSFILTLRPGGSVMGNGFAMGVVTESLPATFYVSTSAVLLTVLGCVASVPRTRFSALYMCLATFSYVLLMVELSVPFGPLETIVIVKYSTKVVVNSVFFNKLFSLTPLAFRGVVLLMVFTMNAFIMFGVLCGVTRRCVRGFGGRDRLGLATGEGTGGRGH